jgi:hypothetical protein
MNALHRSIRIADLDSKLATYERQFVILPGIVEVTHRHALLQQITDSIRRIEYISYIRDADHSELRLIPNSGLFDPLKAAAAYSRRGNLDEAYWLVFLATHFGKHALDGWQLTEAFYGRLGQGRTWSWAEITANLPEFRQWVITNETILRGGDGFRRRFSNHRKYESLSATSRKGLVQVIESYIAWIRPPRTHNQFVREMHALHGQNPQTIFGVFYKSMDAVSRFGRLGKFDYLTMLGKLGICPISPDSAYLNEATGPRMGARLLYLGNPEDKSADKQLDNRLVELDSVLEVGMQVLEDSICNWQKSPSRHIYFRG